MAYHIIKDNRPPFKLEDFAIHCNEDLKKGAALVYDGCHWRLMNLGEIAEDLPELIERLEQLKEEIDGDIQKAIDKADAAYDKAEAVAQANPEYLKYIYVTMDGDTSTTTYDEFITEDCDVTLTWVSGSPNGLTETYVGNGFVRIDSSEDESGTVRLRISKPRAL